MNYNLIRSNFERALRMLNLNKSQKINENELPISIGRDLIGTVDDKDTQTIDLIKNAVGGSNYRDLIINFLVNDVNFPKKEAEILFTYLNNNGNIEAIADYFTNRDFDINSNMNRKINAAEINSRFGLSGGSSLDFFNFGWRTSPPMGPGEAYLSAIIAGAKRPKSSEKGDVMVGGAELEVKGPGGRIIGQKGYGDGKQMRVAFANAIRAIADEFQTSVPDEVSNKSDSYWNITKKDARGIEECLRAIAKEVRHFNGDQIKFISSQLIEAYQTFLLNLDINGNAWALRDAIKSDGSINVTAWHDAMLEIYFDYYYSIEGFDAFAMTSRNGYFAIIDPRSFMDFYRAGNIKIDSNPGFTNGAGVQGATYSISLS